MDDSYVRNPTHGGKVTCHKCNGFIPQSELLVYHSSDGYSPEEFFHQECYNPYSHYYGLDRPID